MHKKYHEHWRWGIFGLVAVCGVFVILQVVLPRLFSSVSYDVVADQSAAVAAAVDDATTTATTTPVVPPPALHVPTPASVKAVYMSECAAGTPSLRDSIISFVKESSLNAVVIDIKDYSGGISFPTDDPALAPYVSKVCGARDMKAYIERLHQEGIYVIGRITTFQDPLYVKGHPSEAVQKKGGGVWTDYHGLAFVDVGAKPFWDHIVALGRASYAIGFDELNFDYVRFPSDGPMSQAVYSWDEGVSKSEALEGFFKYLNEHLRPADSSQDGPKLSADLFGMTTTDENDLNIGQMLERALPYFDYIDPMVYPSHYPTGFNGYKNVNAHAYDIVHDSLARAVERAQAPTTTVAAFGETPIASTSPQVYEKPVFAAEKIRPWLQSFDYPVAYTPAMVADQIRASEDDGLSAWLFWDAANKYTSLRKVLAPSSDVTMQE